MQKITTFLWFDRQAEEAAKFYTSIFPDSHVDGVWAMPAESPSGPPGSVKVVDDQGRRQRRASGIAACK